MTQRLATGEPVAGPATIAASSLAGGDVLALTPDRPTVIAPPPPDRTPEVIAVAVAPSAASAQVTPVTLTTSGEKVFLYVLLGAVLVSLMAVFVVTGQQAQADYRAGMQSTHADARPSFSPSVGLMFLLQLARARDAAVVKLSALFLAYLVVILGCLFVLKGVEAAFQLRLRGVHGMDSALKTSSPGLVLITFGCVLVALTVLVQSTITTQIAPEQTAASEPSSSNAAQPPPPSEFSKHAILPPPE
jgi:uncharacterized membrane protein